MIIFDIETIPAHSTSSEFYKQQVEKISPPGNYKDPVKISDWMETKASGLHAGMALKPGQAQIVCICAYDVEQADNFSAVGELEKDILEQFARWLAPKPMTQSLAGYNVVGFDIPILSAAYISQEIPVPSKLAWALGHPFENIDLMRMFPNAGGLQTFASALGLTVTTHNGSEVAQLAAANNWEAIQDLCMEDVQLCRDILALL